jgi:hypothetical protein
MTSQAKCTLSEERKVIKSTKARVIKSYMGEVSAQESDRSEARAGAEAGDV